jgi:hypothetical protein
MLSHYEGRGFEKHFINALIEGLKKDRDEWEDIECQIEYAIKTYKEEGKQLYIIANYIKDEVQSEIDLIQDKVLKTDNFTNEQEKKSINRLNDFIGFIQYNCIDYYEVARQLTNYYKENQKTKLKKVA